MISKLNKNPTTLSHIKEEQQDIEIYFNAVFNNIRDPIFVKDEECRLILVNDAFCDFIGAPRHKMIGKTLAENLPLNDIEDFLSIDKQVLEDGKEVVCEETLSFSGLPFIFTRTRKSRFIDHNGHYFLIGVIQDITERKQTQEKLELAATVFNYALEGIMVSDASGAIIEVNETFSRMTGYTREELLGKNPRILQSGRQSPEFYSEMWGTLLKKGHWRGEIWNRHKNGEIYAEMLTISTVKNAAGNVQHYVSLCTDITSMKTYQVHLEHIAHYDVLTNLPNRVLLADRLNQAMVHCQRNNQSLAVAFMDLDGFKSVNDNYGHNVGDELLIEVSQRMKSALREGDTLARIGGDEFIAVIVDLKKAEESKPVLERLLKSAAKSVSIDNVVMHVSASIGFVFYPLDAEDANQLIQHADKAMYVAKQVGKNRYHRFDSAADSS